MPRKPKRPCSYPNCPKLTDKQFCDEHERLEKDMRCKIEILKQGKDTDQRGEKFELVMLENTLIVNYVFQMDL